MTTPSAQRAYEIGQKGGHVNTHGLAWQQKEQLDAARNAGFQGK